MDIRLKSLLSLLLISSLITTACNSKKTEQEIDSEEISTNQEEELSLEDTFEDSSEEDSEGPKGFGDGPKPFGDNKAGENELYELAMENGYEAGDYALYSLNVHDWLWPEESMEAIKKVVDLHDEYQIPIGIYFTSNTLKTQLEIDPEFDDYLLASDMVYFGYHHRPPYPMYKGFDNIGLADMEEDELYETIYAYESQAIDMATGALNPDELGGYAYVKQVFGHVPMVGLGSSVPQHVNDMMGEILKDMGAEFVVGHGGDIELGDTTSSLTYRPEDFDLKLYENVNAYQKDGRTGEDIILASIDELSDQEPLEFMGIKYHENNFYLTGTPFWPIYWTSSDKSTPQEPPYDIEASYNNALAIRPLGAQKAHFDMYEDVLAYIVDNPEIIGFIGYDELLELSGLVDYTPSDQ